MDDSFFVCIIKNITKCELAIVGLDGKVIASTDENTAVNKNDIVVFVGPNNAGKSEALFDIYQLSNSKVPTVVVSGIEVIKDGNLKQLLEMTSIKHDNGTHIQ